MAGGKLVWQDAEGIWLAPSLAAKPKPKPKRKISDAALESQHTRVWKKEAVTRRYSGGGPGAAHLERIMIAETLDAAKAKRPKED